jgi:TFIIF-interacting CTD phosphatase-like protein
MSLPQGRGTPNKSLVKKKPARKTSKPSKPVCGVNMTAPSSGGHMLSPHAPRPYRSWIPKRGKSGLVFVVDLDHTVVDSTGFKHSHVDRRYVLDMQNQVIKGSTRPNHKQFLSYLKAYGEVVIWTAGEKEYAEAIVNILYEGEEKPKMVWHRDHCAYNEDEDYYHKPLQRIADELKYDRAAILMIDDRTYTFVTNPSNGLLIPPYEGSDDDDALGQIVDWLEMPSTRYSWSTTQLDKSRVFSP